MQLDALEPVRPHGVVVQLDARGMGALRDDVVDDRDVVDTIDLSVERVVPLRQIVGLEIADPDGRRGSEARRQQ